MIRKAVVAGTSPNIGQAAVAVAAAAAGDLQPNNDVQSKQNSGWSGSCSSSQQVDQGRALSYGAYTLTAVAGSLGGSAPFAEASDSGTGSSRQQKLGKHNRCTMAERQQLL